MPSPFHGIEMAGRALRSFQRALEVSGHNVANVNTKGYSRQAVDFVTTDPTTLYFHGRHSLGTGVTIASIGRIRDAYLDERARGAVSDQGRFGTYSSKLVDIEGISGEPGETGIANALDKFFDAWSAYGSNPNQVGNRTQVKLAGQTLALRVRRTYSELDTMSDQIQVEAEGIVNRINELGEQIHALNGQIRESTATGAQPSDLLDQRDTALEELSSLANVNVSMQTDGTVTVAVGKLQLVGGAAAFAMPATFDAANQGLVGGGVAYPIRSGKLAGLLQSMDRVAAEKTQLDTLANNLRSQVNTLHETGTNANGTTGVMFFNDVTPPAAQTGAIDFDLSAAILASDANISSGTSGDAGDGGLALSLSGLRNASVGALGNRTFAAFYRDGVAELGADAAYFHNALSTTEAILEQIDSQRQAVSGVSLDDEMANMLRFQRSYQAAAKVMTIFDQSTQDLINMLQR